MCGAHCVVAMQHRGNQQPGTNFYITYLIASPSPSCLPQESQVLPRGHGNKEPHQLRELQAESGNRVGVYCKEGEAIEKEKYKKRGGYPCNHSDLSPWPDQAGLAWRRVRQAPLTPKCAGGTCQSARCSPHINATECFMSCCLSSLQLSLFPEAIACHEPNTL